MLSAPRDLSEQTLSAALADGWGIVVETMAYRPVGWGSHHWAVTDTGRTTWFVTVDELETKALTEHEPLDESFARLRAALASAAALRDNGRAFVVAPVATRHGEPLIRSLERFGVAVYPFLDGESFEFGEFANTEHRVAVLELVVAVHNAPHEVRRDALVDDFTVPHRDQVVATLAGHVTDRGPYTPRMAHLLVDNAAAIKGLFGRYDELVAAGARQMSRTVLTHGEPHAGNTMRTSEGWRFLDWDTAMVALPERDLWDLDPGDGSVLAAYEAATGVTPAASMLELFRLRWDLADLAYDVARFRRPHTGNLDDRKAFDLVSRLVAGLGSG